MRIRSRFWRSIKKLFSYCVYRPLLFFLPHRRKRECQADMAIVCMASLGDFITFCAVAKCLRLQGRTMVLVCKKGCGIEEFADMTGYFQKIYPISVKWKHRVANIAYLNQIKVKRVVVAPAQRHILSDLYAISIAAEKYIMPDTLQACSLLSLKKLVDRKVDKLVPVTAVYELERYEQYLEDAQAIRKPLRPYQFEKDPSEEKDRRDPYIIIFPGAGGGQIKQWPVERYATVAKLLQQEQRCRVLICGTSSERALGEKLQQLIGSTAENLCGKTSLISLKDILSKCFLVLANDSGSAHFSIACNAPTIIVCGGWEYGRFYPNQRMPSNCIAITPSPINRCCIPCGESKPICGKKGEATLCILDVEEDFVSKMAILLYRRICECAD